MEREKIVPKNGVRSAEFGGRNSEGSMCSCRDVTLSRLKIRSSEMWKRRSVTSPQPIGIYYYRPTAVEASGRTSKKAPLQTIERGRPKNRLSFV